MVLGCCGFHGDVLTVTKVLKNRLKVPSFVVFESKLPWLNFCVSVKNGSAVISYVISDSFYNCTSTS